MKRGDRKVVGKIFSRDFNYTPLEGKVVQVYKRNETVRDTWYVHPIMKNGLVSKNAWYVHIKDLMDITNEGTIKVLKGEIMI
ncbi:hypothetical protein_gp249 [Bacillus phage vB_BceM_WH1]|nr:hypothetical protein_gp249 [Bacillus phage vB_BceM_WH1]